MTQHIDVTDKVKICDADGEVLPLTECICGAEWDYWAGPFIHPYKDILLTECPECHRKFWFKIHVYEVVE